MRPTGATMAAMQGGRRRRWWMRDFALAKLADDEGDVAAAVARDLVRGAVIPSGGEGGGGGGGGGVTY